MIEIFNCDNYGTNKYNQLSTFSLFYFVYKYVFDNSDSY